MQSLLAFLIFSLHLALRTRPVQGVLHCPRVIEMPPVPDNFMDLDDDESKKYRGAGGFLFTTLMKDAPFNLEKLEDGVTYAFWAFKPGTPLENWCNGGAHAYIVLAESSANGAKLRSMYWDLSIDDNIRVGDHKPESECADSLLYQISTFRSAVFEDKIAAKWMGRKYVFQALGKVGYNEDFRTIVRMVDQQATNYFNGFLANKYNYVLNNCGHFVDAMAEFLMCENHISTQVCPVPIKRRSGLLGIEGIDIGLQGGTLDAGNLLGGRSIGGPLVSV